jgi:anti-sigma regulatory factor (Ser/Thr protein kinase)
VSVQELSELIDLEAPLDGDFQPVIRLIIGGIAVRLDFALEEIDDLQLAVERLLAETGRQATVRFNFELEGERTIRARIGPLSEGPVSAALGDGEAPAGQLTLKRILRTVVDSFGVEKVPGGRVVVRLEKQRAA